MTDAAQKVAEVTQQISQELASLTMGEAEPIIEEAPPADDPIEEAPAESQGDPDEIRARENGWKDLETYTAEGGDPAKWRGFKAFNQFYDRDIERREIEETAKELKKLNQQMIEQFARTQEEERRRHQKELEEAMEQAKFALDFEKYGQLVEQKKNLEKQAQPQNREHPVIQNYRKEKEFIDPNSEKFNPAFNQIMESMQQKELVRLCQGDYTKVDEALVKKSLDSAFEASKSFFPDLFKTPEKPKPERVTPKPPATAAGGKPAAGADLYSKLDPVARDMYAKIKKVQGEKAAEIFLKSITR